MTDLARIPHPEVIEAVRGLATEDQSIYLVGGAVRDLLLNRTVHDLDFALPAGAQKTARKIANWLGGAFFMLDAERDTARVICRSQDQNPLVLDFAVFRGRDLEEDLRGRDFTINAIALDLNHPDQIIDPLDGADDLLKKRIRVCSQSSLLDDPLRILRGIRQSMDLKLRIDPETLRLMRAGAAGLIRTANERKRDELFRIFDGSGGATGIRVMEKIGALDFVLPELAEMKRAESAEENWAGSYEHALAVVQALETLLSVLVGRFDEEGSANLSHGLAVLHLGGFRQHLAEHFSHRFTPDRSARSLILLSALLKTALDYVSQNAPVSAEKKKKGTAIDQAGERCAQMLALSLEESQYLKLIAANEHLIRKFAERGQLLSRREIYQYFRKLGRTGIDLTLVSLADLFASYRSALPQALWKQELEICQQLMDCWWNRASDVVDPPRLINGEDAMQLLGKTHGPFIGQLLEAVREEQAAGLIDTRDQAMIFAQHWAEIAVLRGAQAKRRKNGRPEFSNKGCRKANRLAARFSI